MAYRFVTGFDSPFIVQNEQVVYNFPSDNKAFVSYVRGEHKSIESQYSNSFENLYEHINLSQWDKSRIAFSPLVVESVNNKKICLVESDLFNYPGMFFYNADGSASLTGKFALYPEDIQQGGHNMLQDIVKSRENFIAKCEGKTAFPWRVLIVAEHDKDLANSDMVYKLATPSQGDYSWVKPGKVAWEWWNGWNIYGVDFKSGINNDTYKYYIDFASSEGIEYVILDEGWAVNLKADLMQVVPEINLEELAAYAKKKNVGLILWAGYYAFERDMENICRHYSEMGIKGFKVDFMDRDDQLMVDFHHRGARIAAKYKMLLDYHGTYKPTGLQRTYPNVINFEGVHGLEQMKWAGIETDQVTYDVIIPFTRMVAGPLDYTQGAMRNADKGNFRGINTEAMSQGTRCRQLAQYIIFESPLNMLCDNPSNYLREQECLGFITSVPTVWDNTVALDGKISEYIAIARQKGENWYVGAMTNWDEHTLELDLSFLGNGNYIAEIFRDGINANKVARDYKKEVVKIPSGRKFTVNMASGGGFAMKIYPEK
jgi:alpha-glucosidase